jgi:hypothetical protein
MTPAFDASQIGVLMSFLVGGIGFMNILPASMTERIRKICIRKAIGALHYEQRPSYELSDRRSYRNRARGKNDVASETQAIKGTIANDLFS